MLRILISESLLNHEEFSVRKHCKGVRVVKRMTTSSIFDPHIQHALAQSHFCE